MTNADFHLAQINVAKMLYPMEHPGMADFVARLDAVNALADRAPGFVWRYSDDVAGPNALVEDQLLLNMSVWKSVEALFAYTYKSGHAEVFRSRKSWFEMPVEPHLALWWVPRGHVPSVEEGKVRLAHLRRQGPSEAAFTLKKRFAPALVQALQ